MTTPYAPVCAGTTATAPLQVASTGLATAGFVLTSNGSAALPSFQSVGSAGAITTINGDTGSITGSTVTIYANNAVQNCGATVLFSNSGSTSTLKVTDAHNNTIIGFQAGLGATSITGFSNVGLGLGTLSGPLSSGQFNTCLGNSTGNSITTQSNNTFVGTGAGFGVQADSNTALGYSALGYTGGHPSGTLNLCLGYSSGFPYHTTEASNILVGALGVTGDSNTTRIGYINSASSTQTACYIDGIAGVTVANSQMVTINSSTGQLGSQAISAVTSYTDEATNFSAVSNNGYFVTGAAIATLPASPSQGNVISFIVDTASTLTVTANTGQKIRLGASISALAGTAASNSIGDSLTLVYRSSDAVWFARDSIGTWTIT